MSFVPSFPSDCSLACTDSDSHKRADDLASLGTLAAGVGMAAGTTAYAAYKVAQRKDKNQTPQVASNARGKADSEHSLPSFSAKPHPVVVNLSSAVGFVDTRPAETNGHTSEYAQGTRGFQAAGLLLNSGGQSLDTRRVAVQQDNTELNESRREYC